jgi:hypothetical protein
LFNLLAAWKLLSHAIWAEVQSANGILHPFACIRADLLAVIQYP